MNKNINLKQFCSNPGDSHSDHKIVFEAASSCSKSFRNKFVKSGCVMRVLSETERALIMIFSYYVSLEKSYAKKF